MPKHTSTHHYYTKVNVDDTESLRGILVRCWWYYIQRTLTYNKISNARLDEQIAIEMSHGSTKLIILVC